MSLTAGTCLGAYEILAPLGAGGMGEVYRAKDARLERVVALKVLPEEFFESKEKRQRFEREAKLLAALSHPNIAAVYSFEEVPGSSSSPSSRHLLVMELVEGRMLRLLVDGPMPPRRLLDLAVQIADGLAAAHEAGIVHRDLKPENVMVSKDGFVKILDFGLAKKLVPEGAHSNLATASAGTEAGVVLGTVAYMSPEQARGEKVDYRSDQFALGSVLYEMATGKRAFERPTAPQTLSAIIAEEAVPLGEAAPKAPAPLRWIVERCLAKDPNDRYASTRDLARELKGLRDHLGDLVSSGGTALGVAPRRRLSPALLAGPLVLVLAGLAAGIVAGRKLWPSARQSLRFEQVTFGQAGIWQARFTPDGQTIVYSAPGGSLDERGVPVHELFTVRPGTPEARPLGITGDILAISRFGEMAILQTKTEGDSGTLAVAPLGGGAPREILEDAIGAAGWAPDGRSLAVLHRVDRRIRLEFPVGHALRETTGFNVRVSPDGKLLTLTGPGGVAKAVDLEGHERVLGRWPGVSGPVWSPDGRRMWISRTSGSNTEILSLGLDGTLRPAASIPGTYQLHDMSADGRVLAERYSPTSTMRAAGVDGRERDLGWLDEFGPAGLSEDGRLLLFNVFGAGGGPSGAVYVRGTDGSAPKRIASGNAIALSQDGKWALCRGPGGAPPLTLVPTGAGQARTLEAGAITRYVPAGGFNPDGTSVWFNAVEPGHSARCYVQPLAGGPPKMLPAGVGGVSAISPDGSLLAVVNTATERPEFVTAESGARRPIPGSEAGEAPIRWSGDGRSFFVCSFNRLPATVHRIDLATGRREKVTKIDLGEGYAPESVEVFLSGDALSRVYGARRFSSDLFVVEGLK